MIEQLPAAALRQWLDDTSRGSPFIVDVREAWEYGICSIPNSRSMPMQEIPARVGELPHEIDIVVVCHHGMRSLQVANYLAQAGFIRVFNLSGGIAAWADQVDPAMPRY